MTYWIDLFTVATWAEFQDAGANTAGFREGKWNTVQQVQKGDILLCYLTKISLFVGLLEVTGPAYQDSKRIWKEQLFPVRLPVKVILALKPEYGISVYSLRSTLSCFANLDNPNAWTGRFRGSPTRWSTEDGEIVRRSLELAKEAPTRVDLVQLKVEESSPTAFKATDKEAVTIPEDENESSTDDSVFQPTEHTEIQATLLQLGSDLGFDVWVARNDKGKKWGDKTLGSFPRIRPSLPLQFDEATNRTIELIDVLWLQNSSYVAAFEIESTTSIYSGLLRMSDLVAMQPNLTIPLYLVAPQERFEKVRLEVNRPTFRRLSKPLRDICRFISFSKLKDKIKSLGSNVRYLRPEFLGELSEDCALIDAE